LVCFGPFLLGYFYIIIDCNSKGPPHEFKATANGEELAQSFSWNLGSVWT
jgi:hypothetical protein